MTSKLNPILVSSLVAVFCGLILLWFSHTFPEATRILADRVGLVLYYPETPARELRTLVQLADNWMNERRTLQERANVLLQENTALRIAIQRSRAGDPVPVPGFIGANVTLRYPDSWWKEVRVNRGSEQGVMVGAPAVSEGFMVGRVSRVGGDYAWIELVTSATFFLAAVVVDTWDLGVITGDDTGNIWLMYLPPEKELDNGILVSTALVGDYLPPGIPVGMIEGPGETRDGLTPFRVESGARLSQLYSVQILRAGAERGSP